jgi:hypothetical protein
MTGRWGGSDRKELRATGLNGKKLKKKSDRIDVEKHIRKD